MYIKKQRLLTPGPTPLYPQALHAMMGSDIHHRTEEFRTLYRGVLADLKEVFGTSNDVLTLVASGTGAMEASVANFFSPGDRAIVCSAGKFGERWVEIARALCINPTFILLDEPFSGIDPIAVLDLQKIISDLKAAGIGVLITDHNVRETLSVTDRAYIINVGRIFRQGTPEQLGSDPEVRRVYLGQSFSLV